MAFALSHTIQHPTEGVYLFDICTDKETNVVAVSGSDHGINLFDANTLQFLTQFQGHTDTIHDISFNHEGNSLFSGSSDGTIHLWDVRSGKSTNLQINREVFSITQGSSANEHLLAAAIGSELNLYDIRASKKCFTLSDIHSDDITLARFYPGGDQIFTASEDGIISVNDISVQNLEDDSLVQVFNQEQSINKFGFFGENLSQLYSLSRTEQFFVWDLASQEKINFGDIRERLSTPQRAVEYAISCQYHSPTRSLVLFSGSFSGPLQMHLVDPANEQITFIQNLSGAHTEVVRSVLWFPNRSVLLTAGEDSKLCAWTYQNQNTNNNNNNTQIQKNKSGDDDQQSSKSSKKQRKKY